MSQSLQPAANDNVSRSDRFLLLSVCSGNAAIWAGLATVAGLGALWPCAAAAGFGIPWFWLGFIRAGRQ